MSGTLFTGIWWELWNYYSLPKWVYHIPYVGFLHLFEMPALGYLGYPFFGLFLFSYTAAMTLLLFGSGVMGLALMARRPRRRNISNA